MGENTLPRFQLPRLLAAVDCAPIGYPGLVLHFWLNVTYDPAREDDEDWTAAGQDLSERPVWERDYCYLMGRIIDRVTIPAEYTADGKGEEIPIPDGRALYDLMHREGFEQAIINWAAGQYYSLKAERLRAEVKN